MYDTICGLYPRDADFPQRTHTLMLNRRVLEGCFYDVLPHEFFQEVSDSGELIPLSNRRPSVRYNLCRIVVQDSVSMLFGDQRFPTVSSPDKTTRETLLEVIKETRLNSLMTEVAIQGSIGSACVLMRVLKGRVFFTRLDTAYLTPEWCPDEPDTLLQVTEKYKVLGSVLRDRGYDIPTDRLSVKLWFQRQWTADEEVWFLPWAKEDEAKRGFTPIVDVERSVRHDLGFVPMVWIKNLPGGTDVDGSCTFTQAIHDMIEIDYQLSQAGRGLKYSSDPELMLKEPAMGDSGEINKGAGNAIVVSEKGDAKWLEISGEATAAVMAYVKGLREMAIEAIRGNRASADRMTAAQSGKALELLHQNLIWLAGELRVAYGDDGLLPLIRMVVAAREKMPLLVNRKPMPELQADGLNLRWAAFFSPTERDKVDVATSLDINRKGGNMSRETAVSVLGSVYDTENVAEEITKIEADEQASMEREIELNAQIQVKESGEAGRSTP